MRVLVVEDYEPIREAVAQALREDGFAVDTAIDGKNGLWMARTSEHDAIVLDIMLPEMDGFELLKSLRSDDVSVPVLLLTARDGIDDRIRGLNGGADDYLVKPFSIAELVARVHALIRRSYGGANSKIVLGEIEIDTAARDVHRDGQAIELTAREFALIELLARKRGKVVSRTEIWNSLYDFSNETTSNVVDVYIGYLRKKLDNGSKDSIIKTRRGQGYIIEGSSE